MFFRTPNLGGNFRCKKYTNWSLKNIPSDSGKKKDSQWQHFTYFMLGYLPYMGEDPAIVILLGSEAFSSYA